MTRRATFKIAAILIAYLLVCVSQAGRVHAQPGEQRTPEEIRQQLDARLKQLEERVNEHPEQAISYELRGRVLAELFSRTSDPLERPYFFDRALLDFNKVIEMEPDHWPHYAERARLRLMSDQLKYFEEIRSDYLSAIRSIEKRAATSGSADYQLKLLNDNLSYLYRHRGESLVKNPEWISRLYLDSTTYSAWDDFDEAIDYAKKGVRDSAHWWNVVAGILHKGDLALKRDDYERALAAYQSDEEHLGEEYALVCEKAYSQEVCQREQKDILLTFSIRRGRAFLKLGRAADALKEMNVYFEKAIYVACRDIFRMRAQAHRALGNAELALADEETAKTKNTGSCPFDIQN